MTIRVAIADDYPQFYDIYKYYLECFGGIKVVGYARNGQEAIVICQAEAPDFILMDIEMPIMDGIKATRFIRREFPHVAVIGLTGFENSKRLAEMAQAGVYCCFNKFDSLEVLTTAIYKAAGSLILSD